MFLKMLSKLGTYLNQFRFLKEDLVATRDRIQSRSDPDLNYSFDDLNTDDINALPVDDLHDLYELEKQVN